MSQMKEKNGVYYYTEDFYNLETNSSNNSKSMEAIKRWLAKEYEEVGLDLSREPGSIAEKQRRAHRDRVLSMWRMAEEVIQGRQNYTPDFIWQSHPRPGVSKGSTATTAPSLTGKKDDMTFTISTVKTKAGCVGQILTKTHVGADEETIVWESAPQKNDEDYEYDEVNGVYKGRSGQDKAYKLAETKVDEVVGNLFE